MTRPPGLTPKISGSEDLSGVCWWCGGVADSTEHRHKKTDLKRGGARRLLWFSDDYYPSPRTIRSPNSKSWMVRFGKILCRQCNGTRSQPFDRAYELFSNKIAAEIDAWWRRSGVDFRALYGESWEMQVLNLARYYVKNFGCQLADGNVKPPRTMVDFLNGATHMADVSLCLVKSQAHHLIHSRFRPSGTGVPLYRTPMEAWVDPMDHQSVVGISETAIVGYVGVKFEWHEGWGPQDCFYLHPYPVLNKVKVRAGLRTALAQAATQEEAWKILAQAPSRY